MTELLVLGLSGAFVGAGLSARRRGAPTVLVRALYLFAGLAFVLAVLTFQPNG